MVDPDQTGKAGNLDELLVYCAWQVIARKETCTFERITVECFKQFPGDFALAGYPEYPDSARVNKCWLRCRTDRAWLLGNVKTGFTISPAGEAVARRVQQRLKAGDLRTPERKATRDRTREESLVRFVKTQAPFKRFLSSSQGFVPSVNEIHGVSSSTLDTPPLKVKANLQQLIEAAKAVDDAEVVGFLQVCLAKFNELKRVA